MNSALGRKAAGELPAGNKRRANAIVRSLAPKPNLRYSGDGVDFDQAMAALGLADPAPQHGRPAWRPEVEDAFRDDELDAAAERLEALTADYDAQIETRVQQRLAQIEATRPAPVAPVVPIRAASPIPDAVPRNVPAGSLKITRNSVGQIASAVGPDGVQLQVTSRRAGRIAEVSAVGPDGTPVRVVAKRDAAGMLIGLEVV